MKRSLIRRDKKVVLKYTWKYLGKLLLAEHHALFPWRRPCLAPCRESRSDEAVSWWLNIIRFFKPRGDEQPDEYNFFPVQLRQELRSKNEELVPLFLVIVSPSIPCLPKLAQCGSQCTFRWTREILNNNNNYSNDDDDKKEWVITHWYILVLGYSNFHK